MFTLVTVCCALWMVSNGETAEPANGWKLVKYDNTEVACNEQWGMTTIRHIFKSCDQQTISDKKCTTSYGKPITFELKPEGMQNDGCCFDKEKNKDLMATVVIDVDEGLDFGKTDEDAKIANSKIESMITLDCGLKIHSSFNIIKQNESIEMHESTYIVESGMVKLTIELENWPSCLRNASSILIPLRIKTKGSHMIVDKGNGGFVVDDAKLYFGRKASIT